MSKNFEADLLKSAIEIGEEIIDKAIIDSNGIHWKTVKSITVTDDLETDVDESIATGVSGILLFYVELYKATKSEVYLNYINSCASWLINHCQKKPATHGFYFGRIGTVFTLLKIAEITQKDHYHQKAVEIALQFKDILSIPTQSFNLYNGLAGSILGLLYLHTEIKEDWILDSVYDGIELLLKKIKSNNDGFYWDNYFGESRSINTKPLCSMPLGASGIGLLFFYLSKYFYNPDYEYIAKQAFVYEDQYYNKDLNNWADFRINVDYKILEKLRKSYFKDNHSHFESENYSANWMYGLVGQVFTRVCAHEIINYKYWDDTANAFENNLNLCNLNSQLLNYTLATGKSGLGLLFLTLSVSKNNNNFFESALTIAKAAIDERTSKKFFQFGFNTELQFEDDSFLMGNAGIGYFYLKLLNRNSDTVLFPILNTSDTGSDHKVYRFNIDYAIDIIARAWYPNTFSILCSKSVFKTRNSTPELLKKSLIFNIEQSIEVLQDPRVEDAYNYDKIKLNIQDIIDNNYSHFKICRAIEVSKNRNLLESNSREELMEKTLQLNQYSYFITSDWDWKSTSLIDVQKKSKKINILYSLGEEYTLSETQYVILNSFIIPQKVNNIYKVFIAINERNAMDSDCLLHSFIGTIRYFISKGILRSVNKSLSQYFTFKPKVLNSVSKK